MKKPTRMSSPEIRWRGSAYIWTSKSLTNSLWPFGWLIAKDQCIHMKALWKTVSFIPEQVVEVRRYQWPFPTVTIVARVEEGNVVASFSVLSGRRLNTTLSALGLSPTSNHRWYLGGMESDRLRYELYESQG